MKGGDNMEEVIAEYRLIETDDGYRIEMKGDKDQLKFYLHGPWGAGWRRGRGQGFGRRRPHQRPRIWRHMATNFGPWVQEDDNQETSAKDA
jgi:hypothetical protein